MIVGFFHVELINTYNSVKLWEQISCDSYFMPRGSFSTDSCPTFVTYLESQTQSTIDCCQLPPTNEKHLELTNLG